MKSLRILFLAFALILVMATAVAATSTVVTGQVFIDYDGDGVKDIGDPWAPIGWPVKVYNSNYTQVIATTTVSWYNGLFNVTVPSGTYHFDAIDEDGRGWYEYHCGTVLDSVSGPSDTLYKPIGCVQSPW